MQLNDILEENSIKTISQKTKISEENLENLLAKNFDQLKKVKTLGFISIIEREYNADLSALREESHEYYAQLGDDKSNTLGVPISQEKKGKSNFFVLIILALLAYATWYFLTQFDKKYLSEMIPFIDEAMIESFMGESETKNDTLEALTIGSATAKSPEEVSPATTSEEKSVVETSTETSEVNTLEVQATTESSVENASSDTLEVTQTVEDITPDITEKKSVSIVPVSRLWFGVVDMQTQEREHFSISDAYELDVSDKKWLVATSSAPFSLLAFNATKEFNDAKEHYLKIDANGIEVLSKSDYIALGGWSQW